MSHIALLCDNYKQIRESDLPKTKRVQNSASDLMEHDQMSAIKTIQHFFYYSHFLKYFIMCAVVS